MEFRKNLFSLAAVAVAVIIIAVIFVFLSAGDPDPGDESGYDDIGLAENSVREFIGNSSAVLEYKGTDETPYADFYIFSAGDSGIFYVDPVGYKVSLARFPGEPEKPDETKMSLEEAESIARAYIAEKNSPADAEKLETVEAKLLDHGAYSEYSFGFNEIEDGVHLFKNFHILVDPWTGDVISYIRLWRETEVSLVPAVSEEEALKIAEDQFEGIVVEESDARLSIQYPEENEQKLVWMIEITGEPKDYVMTGGLVSIDAQTGEVYLKSPYL